MASFEGGNPTGVSGGKPPAPGGFRPATFTPVSENPGILKSLVSPAQKAPVGAKPAIFETRPMESAGRPEAQPPAPHAPEIALDTGDEPATDISAIAADIGTPATLQKLADLDPANALNELRNIAASNRLDPNRGATDADQGNFSNSPGEKPPPAPSTNAADQLPDQPATSPEGPAVNRTSSSEPLPISQAPEGTPPTPNVLANSMTEDPNFQAIQKLYPNDPVAAEKVYRDQFHEDAAKYDAKKAQEAETNADAEKQNENAQNAERDAKLQAAEAKIQHLETKVTELTASIDSLKTLLSDIMPLLQQMGEKQVAEEPDPKKRASLLKILLKIAGIMAKGLVAAGEGGAIASVTGAKSTASQITAAEGQVGGKQ